MCMAQANQTANDLILNAYFLIGEIDPDEPVPTPYTSLGLQLLNDIIHEFTGTVLNTPLTKSIDFQLTAGKYEYTFSNIVDADVVSNRIVNILYGTIHFSSLDWPVLPTTRTPLYINARSTGVQTRPTLMLLVDDVEFSTIRFFATPDQNYDFTLQAKFYLDDFDLFSPIRNIPLSIQRFLRYALARELVSYFPSANWPDRNEKEYMRMFDDLRSSSDFDWTPRRSGLMVRRANFYSGNLSTIQSGI